MKKIFALFAILLFANGIMCAQSANANDDSVDLANYHGFLLDKGNCVYVAYNYQSDYEIAAVRRIKNSIKADGLWKVVDNPRKAHFVLQYNVSVEGSDFIRLFIRPRDNYEQIPYIDMDDKPDPKAKYFMCAGDKGNEDLDDNIIMANDFMEFVLPNYRAMLSSNDFIASVKAGQLLKAKGNKEKWYVLNLKNKRKEADADQIKALHDLFYR